MPQPKTSKHYREQEDRLMHPVRALSRALVSMDADADLTAQMGGAYTTLVNALVRANRGADAARVLQDMRERYAAVFLSRSRIDDYSSHRYSNVRARASLPALETAVRMLTGDDASVGAATPSPDLLVAMGNAVQGNPDKLQAVVRALESSRPATGHPTAVEETLAKWRTAA
jgi:pentatricopeptide repeat protein